MNCLLDTNVVSLLMQPQHEPSVVDWIAENLRGEQWISAVTLHEIEFGLSMLPEGRKREDLWRRYRKVVRVGLGQRVIPFEEAAASLSAEVGAVLARRGTGIDTLDLMILASALASDLPLVTRNVKHFPYEGIAVINPWAEADREAGP